MRNRSIASLVILMIISNISAQINLSDLNSAALTTTVTTVSCTLDNGNTTTCYEIKFRANYVDDDGPFCPATISDVGGMAIYEPGAPYTDVGLAAIDANLLNTIESDGFDIVDPSGNVNLNNPGTGGTAPVSGTSYCLQAAADDDLQTVYLIPVTPQILTTPNTIESVEQVGVSLNGIPLKGAPPGVIGGGPGGGGPGGGGPGGGSTSSDVLMPSLDACGGHHDPGGYYHWHMIANSTNEVLDDLGITAISCTAITQDGTALMGYAMDGYPIYGQFESGTTLPSGLDACNGHTISGNYHYHAVSGQAPNIPPCLVGASASNNFSYEFYDSSQPINCTIGGSCTTSGGAAGTYDSSCNCQATAVTACTVPAALSCDGSTSITAGDSATSSATGGTGGTVTWSITPTSGVSSTSGTGTNTGSITFSNSGSYTVTFTSTNSTSPSGCSPTAIVSCTRTITVNAAVISCTSPTTLSCDGSMSITAGDSATSSATGGTGGTVTWSIAPTSGVSSTSGTGTSTGSITFSNSGSYTVTFTSTNSTSPSGCSPTAIVSCTRTITVNAAVISCTSPTALSCDGPTSITAGDSATSSATGGTGGTVTWSITPTSGVSSTSGTGTNTGSITFSNSGSYTVTFTSTNSTSPSGCSPTAIVSCTRTITVNAAPPGCGGTDPSDDFDCDGVINSSDLDDDNDGILDVDECAVTIGSSTNVKIDSKILGNQESGIFVEGGTTYKFASTNFSNQGVASGIAMEGPCIGEFLNIYFSNSTFGGGVCNDGQTAYYVADFNLLPFSPLNDGKQVFVLFVDMNGNGVNDGSDHLIGPVDPLDPSFEISPNVSGELVFYFNDTSFADNLAVLEITLIGGSSDCTGVGSDTDNDSISNRFDSDSDNDGCPDAVEGGGSFMSSNLDGNDMLTGGVDSNGIPTVAGSSGQSIGDSQDAAIQGPDCSICELSGTLSVRGVNPSVCGFTDGYLEITGLNMGSLSTVNATWTGVAPQLATGLSLTGGVLIISNRSAGNYINLRIVDPNDPTCYVDVTLNH